MILLSNIMQYINDYDIFVFDLDDTLVKSEKYHYKAWIKPYMVSNIHM